MSRRCGFLCSLVVGMIIATYFNSVGYALDKDLLQHADQSWQEQSYQIAIGRYRRVLKEEDIKAKQLAEIQFKLADSLWRSGNRKFDEEAKKILIPLTELKGHHRWSAEADESLAEFYLDRDRWSSQEKIKEGLSRAREYWAGETDIKLARPRFIKVSFTLADYLSQNWGWYYSEIKPTSLSESPVPLPGTTNKYGLNIIFDEILKVARKKEDKAKAYYSLGMVLSRRANTDKEKKLVKEYFQGVIEQYSDSEWCDDAYYYLGEYYNQRQQFKKALRAYQGLVGRYRKGESKWLDDAKRRIEDITEPKINTGIGYTFLPESEIQFNLSWRNIKQAQFTIYKMDLVKNLQKDLLKAITDSDYGIDNYREYLERIVTSNRYRLLPVEASWTLDLKNEGKHMWHQENKGLAAWRQKGKEEDLDPRLGKLAPGAYLLLVTSGKQKAYELILVTDLGLVAKTAGRSALFYAFNAKNGQPQSDIPVKYQYRYYNDKGNWIWDEGSGTTNEEGLLSVKLKASSNRKYSNRHNLFVVASNGEKQAFAQGNYYHHYNSGQNWWLYAFSDRPAYRPNEKISYKGILRQYTGEDYKTPAGMKVKVNLYDPRGNSIKETFPVLNQFGSFHDSITLDEKAPLGAYRLDIRTVDNRNQLSSATIFRLEEYKLPEFQVSIQPAPKDGEGAISTCKLGDTIAIELDAQYYFGGPVALAEVEFLVHQKPYYHTYQPLRQYPWYYHDTRGRYYDGGPGQLVKKENIKTDEHGKATIEIETPQNAQNDLRYTIEARVVDQSRREILSRADIKVTRRSYFAYLNSRQQLYGPGDKVRVDIKTLTANNEPVSVDGKVTVYRKNWHTPVIREADSRNMKTSAAPHYVDSELFTRFVKTDDKGEAKFEFEPDEDGYYYVKYTAFDSGGEEIEANTSVYVCDKASRDIGYHYGGLQIIAEKDTFNAGDTARFMVVNNKPDGWVLITLERDEILDYHLYQMDGPVKLIEVPIRDFYTPNLFVNGLSADHFQLKMAKQEVIVPPEKRFLNIKITTDKEVYTPREEARVEVEVTDHQARPVQTELALGMVDASVYYIQSEYAKDIREFFYGQKRPLSVNTQTSFNQRRYMQLVRTEKDQLINMDEKLRRDKKDQSDVTVIDQVHAVFSEETKRFGYGDFGLVGGEPMLESEESGLMPASAPMEGKLEALNKRSLSKLTEEMPGKAGEDLDQPQARSDFRSTVFWGPSVTTDENGRARVTLAMPDSLTTWRSTARAISTNTQVGNITQEVRTKKDIIVRLQAPRFFTERDKVTISANVHNYTETDQKIKASIKAEGLKVLEKTGVWVDVPANGEKRVDWPCLAEKEGQARITVMAQARTDSDAMVKSYTIIPHGIEKFIARADVLKSEEPINQDKELIFDIPEERIPSSTSLQIRLSPSMAAAMLDALPYLADYPYGCVEQTISRFLPSVIVVKTLQDLGISKQQALAYISDVLEPRGDPKGHPKRSETPNLDKLGAMTRDGLKRLYDFQHSDGGWGWWKKGDSDRFMSAYVVWGLALARDAGINVKNNVISRGVSYLRKELVEEEDNPDMLAWMLNAISQTKSRSKFDRKQSERLWRMRDKLNPYTRALFALSEFNTGNAEHAQILARNLANGILEDKENGTAHWGESGIHYRWSEGGVEATAFCIKALANIDPQSPYLEPAVKWMALNRRGASWKNTRDTAIAILGLSDYLKSTNELNPDYEYEILVNNKSVRKGNVSADNVFTFARSIHLDNDHLKDGKNNIKVKFNGAGALYFSGYLKYFTLEENITPAGNEVFVKRQYFKEAKKETLLKGYVSDWQELKSGDEIKSGERVRVDITLDAKNHYEYLVVEDYKPAGFEAVELKSGTGEAESIEDNVYGHKDKTWFYKEFRDQKAAFFIPKLKQGEHKISYELRAEIPGTFHGMPNQVHAMYVPEIRANSAEIQMTVLDRN